MKRFRGVWSRIKLPFTYSRQYLHTKTERFTRWIAKWIPDARGLAIIFLGIDAVSRGWAYLPFTEGPKELPYGLDLITQHIPIYVWGFLWFVVGFLCIIQGAIRGRTWLAVSLYVGLRVAWGMAYLIGYLIDPNRDWVNAAHYIWVSFAIAFFSLLVPQIHLSSENRKDE